jgi:hypothetical protein
MFIVGVQIALSTMWVLQTAEHGEQMVRPVEIANDGELCYTISTRSTITRAGIGGSVYTHECSWSVQQFASSQSYVCILLLISVFMSIAHRNVKRNYKETKWLLVTGALSVPVWICWIVGYLYIAKQFGLVDVHTRMAYIVWVQ